MPSRLLEKFCPNVDLQHSKLSKTGTSAAFNNETEALLGDNSATLNTSLSLCNIEYLFIFIYCSNRQ